ncbi:MAG: cysteine desulfurase NifS [Geobacteraceae bacterium]|nr:cysteine desulfurase NifS [Geobacteraceae bacterium]
MMNTLVYMDNNATTAVHPEVIEEMLPYFRTRFGNPSSIHWAGRRAKTAIEDAREKVARMVNCDPSEVVFTSCATESNNTAIKGTATARRSRGNHIITTTVEHPSVLTPCLYLETQGHEVTCLDVDGEGMLDLDALEAAISERTILISVMFANNETGTIFPIRKIGEIAERHGVCFHCDAVQAAGKIPVDVRENRIDLMSISGHKLSAPLGVGALIIRKGARLSPLLHGGPQEGNRRSGSENVAGIVGLGKACEIALKTMDCESKRLRALRDRLERGILQSVPDVRLNGHPVLRLPNTANLSLLHVESDALLTGLDHAGIAVSSGSACSSGALKASHVLKAMGSPEGTTVGTLRFSLGRENTDADVDYVLEVLPDLVSRLRKSVGINASAGNPALCGNL